MKKTRISRNNNNNAKFGREYPHTIKKTIVWKSILVLLSISIHEKFY